MESIEKGRFLRLFIRGGYVLDFSTNDFDTFTMECSGVPLCQKYQLSKGKSLTAYCSEASDADIMKLFSALLKHYESFCKDKFGEEEYLPLYESCKGILSGVILETPAIMEVNRTYIKELSSRAMRDVDNGEYDSAITKSRTLVEEVFCYVIEQKGQVPSEKGDITKLYKQVKDLYHMHPNADVDKRNNELLSGIEKIIDSISEMRNKHGDAHGMGQRRINIAAYHARLYINAAMTIADFILSVWENHQ